MSVSLSSTDLHLLERAIAVFGEDETVRLLAIGAGVVRSEVQQTQVRLADEDYPILRAFVTDAARIFAGVSPRSWDGALRVTYYMLQEKKVPWSRAAGIAGWLTGECVTVGQLRKRLERWTSTHELPMIAKNRRPQM